MPNQTIWHELWARAQREEIGISIRVSNPQAATARLGFCRPRPACSDFTICNTPDINVLFIVKPSVTLDDPAAMRRVRSDLHNEDL